MICFISKLIGSHFNVKLNEHFKEWWIFHLILRILYAYVKKTNGATTQFSRTAFFNMCGLIFFVLIYLIFSMQVISNFVFSHSKLIGSRYLFDINAILTTDFKR